MDNSYDVIVIGGGHAGCEASAAAARTGAKTLLITKHPDDLGTMSCNPAFGGIGKGTLIKEIDALGGIMGKAVDLASIHFRMLNERKGPAVRGPRSQADRNLYREAVFNIMNNYDNLYLLYDNVIDLKVKNNIIESVILKDKNIACKSLIITTGTFLNGMIYIGDETISAGRDGQDSTVQLAKTIYSFGFEMGRLKTGTPPRLYKNSINYEILEKQNSHEFTPFSSETIFNNFQKGKINCYITHTNANTKNIILDNLIDSPVYNGKVNTKGPRYCPSIEDKTFRFSHKDSHQIFLEPEGLDADTVYPNGMSTSLPKDLQIKLFRSIKGLENVEFKKYGYVIEYDYIDPSEINHSLQTKKINNLFLAGQINGTTGYEEAGAQGLVAGINAGHFSQMHDLRFMPDRTNSLIGVMIDDLVTKGVNGEPYRMFTSRAEYRLLLRPDNADIRLTELGYELGCVSYDKLIKIQNKKSMIAKYTKLLKEYVISPSKATEYNIKLNQDGKKRSLFDILSYDLYNITMLKAKFDIFNDMPEDIAEQIEINAKYSKYIERQNEEIKQRKKFSNISIPKNINFKKIGALSNEIVEKLSNFQPNNIEIASNIPGVTPAAITALINHIKNRKYINENK